MQKKLRISRLRYMSALIACGIGLHGIAQEAAAPEQFIHNTTVFVEAWGEGIFNSLNIEKTLTTTTLVNYHLRLGFGYRRTSHNGTSVNFYALPVDAAVSVGGKVKLEMSLGATPFWFSGNKDQLVSAVIAPNFGLHLRFQPPHGGFFFRAGVLVAPMSGLNEIPGNEDFVEKGTWAWNPGLALGITF